MYSSLCKNKKMSPIFMCVAFLSLNLFVNDKEVNVAVSAYRRSLRGPGKRIRQRLTRSSRQQSAPQQQAVSNALVVYVHPPQESPSAEATMAPAIIEKNSSDGEDDVASSSARENITNTSAAEDRYEGEYKDGEYHGDGVMFYKNGDKYTGKWKNGLRDGTGTMTFKNGDKYDTDIDTYHGQYKNGARHGYGTLTYNKLIPELAANRYEGNWKNDREHGKGVMVIAGDDYMDEGIWVDGSWEKVLKEGTWVNFDEAYETPSDVESSPAVESSPTVEPTTADTRTSEPTTNIRNAHATTADTRTSGSTPALASVVEANRLTRSEGDIDHPTTTDDSTADESIAETSESASDAGSEIGNDFTVESPRQIKCSNGDLVIAFPNSPFAEIKYSNGDQYLGEITEVTPGVYTRHGNGALHKVNGDTYDGDWKNDFSHGKGIYTRAKGGRYDGDWEEGKRHGRGVMTLGKREGHGVYTTLSGVKQYDGNWKNGKPEGRGVYTGEWTQRDSTEIPRRIEYDGEWKNGKRHGYGIERVALQFGGKMYSVYTGQWENGEKHGNCVYIDESGTKFNGEWKNGEMHGVAQIGETMSRVAIL